MFVGGITDKTEPTATLKNINEKGETAYFEGTVTGIETAGTFKSFTPAAAFAKGYDTGNVGITLAAVQKPSSLTIDEACDILVAKESNYEVIDGTAAIDDLFFKRMFSVVKVALNGPESLNGEKVSKFSLSAPEGTVLTGRAAINLSSATIDKWNISNNTVTATYTTDAPGFGGEYPGLDNVVWFVVNPGTIESGAKVVFAGETANYTFSKEVTLSKALTFPESQLAVINLTLAEENCTKKAAGNAYVLHEDELIEGDYLIVYGGKAMKASVTKNNRLDYSEVSIENNTIANSDESIVWHISQSGNDWTIFNKKTNNYAASTGTKNQAQLLADGTNNKSLWTVTKTKDASTFEFVNRANSSANPKINASLRNNGTYGYACYAATTGGPLSLYRLSGPIDNTIPTLSVDQTSKVWEANAKDAFVVNVAVNSEGGDWNVTPTALDWASITVDKTAGTITVTPNGANTKETANEATLTVAHTSNASLKMEITLKQNADSGAAELVKYVSTFTDKDLSTKEKVMTWTSSLKANNFETIKPERGVQFGTKKGKFTITGTGHTSNVKKISVIVSTNDDSKSNTISATVGGAQIGEAISLTKNNNYEIVFESTTELSGDIVFNVNDKSKSVYIKSITVNPAN